MQTETIAVLDITTKPVYVTCDGNWFLFLTMKQWIINRCSLYLKEFGLQTQSTKVTTPFNGDGNGFDKPRRYIKTLGVPEGSLKSEDGDNFLFSEDFDAHITHEG